MRDWLRRPTAGRDLGLLGLAVVLVWAVMGGHTALSSAVRYYESVREMVATGDWLFPRLYFVPYFEKPPLTYWLGALPVAVAGFSFHAVHVAPAFAALVSLFATWSLGRLLHGGNFPLGAAGLLLGSGMFLVFITTLTTDPILSACLALCWLGYARHDRGERGWIWLFWVGLALGVLTKGLVAIGLTGAGIALFHLVLEGPLGIARALWRMHPLRGTVILLLINLPWNLLVWQRDPRLIEYFWVRYNFGSFLGGIHGVEVNHEGRWYLYLLIIPIACAPLVLPTVVALGEQGAAAWRLRREPDRVRLYLLACVVGPFLLLTASSSKLATYALPLFPLVALLVADRWRAWAAAPDALSWRRWLVPIQAVAFVGAALAALLLVASLTDRANLPRPHHPVLVGAALAVVGGHVLAGWWWWQGRIAAGAGAALAGLVLAAALVLPRIDDLLPEVNATALAEQVAAHRQPDDLIVVSRDHVHKYHLTLVLGRTHILDGAREVGMGHFVEVHPPSVPLPLDTYHLGADDRPNDSGSPWLLTTDELAAVMRSDRRVWLFCDRHQSQRLEAALGWPLIHGGRRGSVLLRSNLPIPWTPPAQLTEQDSEP